MAASKTSTGNKPTAFQLKTAIKRNATRLEKARSNISQASFCVRFIRHKVPIDQRPGPLYTDEALTRLENALDKLAQAFLHCRYGMEADD